MVELLRERGRGGCGGWQRTILRGGCEERSVGDRRGTVRSAASAAIGLARKQMTFRQTYGRYISALESEGFSCVGGGRCCLVAEIRDRLQEKAEGALEMATLQAICRRR